MFGEVLPNMRKPLPDAIWQDAVTDTFYDFMRNGFRSELSAFAREVLSPELEKLQAQIKSHIAEQLLNLSCKSGETAQIFPSNSRPSDATQEESSASVSSDEALAPDLEPVRHPQPASRKSHRRSSGSKYMTTSCMGEPSFSPAIQSGSGCRVSSVKGLGSAIGASRGRSADGNSNTSCVLDTRASDATQRESSAHSPRFGLPVPHERISEGSPGRPDKTNSAAPGVRNAGGDQTTRLGDETVQARTLCKEAGNSPRALAPSQNALTQSLASVAVLPSQPSMVCSTPRTSIASRVASKGLLLDAMQKRNELEVNVLLQNISKLKAEMPQLHDSVPKEVRSASPRMRSLKEDGRVRSKRKPLADVNAL